MYHSRTPAASCGQECGLAAHDLAGQLLLEAEAVESVRARLWGAEGMSWESPAGRTFRSYLVERGTAVAATAAYLREVALLIDAYGTALSGVSREGVPG